MEYQQQIPVQYPVQYPIQNNQQCLQQYSGYCNTDLPCIKCNKFVNVLIDNKLTSDKILNITNTFMCYDCNKTEVHNREIWNYIDQSIKNINDKNNITNSKMHSKINTIIQSSGRNNSNIHLLINKTNIEFILINKNINIKNSELDGKCNKKILDMKDNYDTKLDEMKNNYDTKLDEMKNNYDTKLSDLKKKYDTSLSDLKKKYDTPLSDLKKKYDTSLSDLKKKYDTPLSDLKNNYDTPLSDLKNNYDTQLSDLKNNYDKPLSDLKDNYDTKLSDLKDNYDTKLFEIQKSFTKTFENNIKVLKNMKINSENLYNLITNTKKDIDEKITKYQLKPKEISQELKELRDLKKCLILNDNEYKKFKITMNKISMELNFIYISFGLNIIVAIFFVFYIIYKK